MARLTSSSVHTVVWNQPLALRKATCNKQTMSAKPCPPLQLFRAAPNAPVKLPLYEASVPAGFAALTEDYIEKALDLNEHCIRNPTATYFARACGDSMRDAGIHDGDILVVDCALEPRDGQVAVVALDGELTVKRLKESGGALYLVPANPKYSPVKVTPEADIRIWGVVTYVVHKV